MMISLTDIEDKLLRPKVAHIVFLTMAVFLAYQLISGVVQYYQIYQELNRTAVQPSHHLAKKNPSLSMQKTLNTPIFGEYIPKALVDLDVKPSGLDLTLEGIVFSNDSKHSMVIISAPGNKTQTFSIGDTVPGGAKIKQITPDGVVLKRDGQLESLSLPKNELNFEEAPEPLQTE
jgi:general secretion pathway protein C